MQPRDVIRLDIAIETQENIIGLYREYGELNTNVTFEEIFINYLNLEDFEFGGDRLKKFLNSI